MSVHEKIAEAIAQDDEGRAYCAARSPPLHRSLDDRDLIYKTKMNDAAAADVGPRSDHPEVVVVAGSMSAEQQRQWDQWAEAHVEILRAEVELLADDIGAVCGTLEKKVAQLENELAALRADNEVLRGIVRGEVQTLKRSRDVAA